MEIFYPSLTKGKKNYLTNDEWIKYSYFVEYNYKSHIPTAIIRSTCCLIKIFCAYDYLFVTEHLNLWL